MRDIFSKVMTGSMIAGAALLVAACGGSETNNASTESNLSDLNTAGALPADGGLDMNGTDMNGTGMNTTDMNAAGGMTDMNSASNATDMNMTGGNAGGM